MDLSTIYVLCKLNQIFACRLNGFVCVQGNGSICAQTNTLLAKDIKAQKVYLMTDQELEREVVAKEYSEICSNIRHYSNLRFATLTVFIAGTLGFGAIAFGVKGNVPAWASSITIIIASIVTVLFWLLELRINQYIGHFQKAAAQIDTNLRGKQWASIPAANLIDGDRVMTVFYLSMLAFWVISLIQSFPKEP